MRSKDVIVAVVAFIIAIPLFILFFRFATDLSMGASIAGSTGPAFIVAIGAFWASRNQGKKR